MNRYEIYLSGEFVKTSSVLYIKNPYNNEPVASTYLAGDKELEKAIVKGREVEEEMKDLPAYKRYDILMQIAGYMKNKRDYLAGILSCEAAKPLRFSISEIDRAIQTFIVAAEESKRLPCECLSMDWTTGGTGKEGIIKYFPVGLIAGISPFNFPMNLAVHKIAPAIASGNPIILKPSRFTPLSVLELAKIMNETGLPKGAVSILPMDRDTGNRLVTDDRIRKLTFTGSPDVGWKMKSQAGRKKITLELGGNAGAILTESTEIDSAMKKCLTGSFAYAGQVCIHLQRILVHESLFHIFMQKFTEATKALRPGSPDDITTDITSMIHEDEAIRVEKWVNEAVQSGAKILTGGKRKGAFFEPTVLTNTSKDMKVNSHEVFGPVVTVEPYSSFQDAVRVLDDTKYGLQAGVFTDSIEEMNYAYRHLQVGGLIINDIPTFRVDHMPYGGVKDSGFGREGVKYAIMEMMEPKLLVKNF